MRWHWVKDARGSASLGHTPADRARLGLFHTRFALAGVSPRLRPAPLRARLAPDGHVLELATSGELGVLHAVMLEREYEPRGTPATILDLGANIGLATLYLHRRFPDARILAVEADPATYTRLVRNVGGLPGVTTLQRAVTGTDGPVRFHPMGDSISSSVCERRGSSGAVEVPGTRIGTLLEQAGLDHVGLLKVDIEGAEFDALEAAPLERVDEIIAEVHYDLTGRDEAAVHALLQGFDVEIRPLPQAQRVLAYAVRKGARLRSDGSVASASARS